MALNPVQSCLFDVKAKNLCQFEKFVFRYNNDEKTDMLLIYGEPGKNSVAAADVYKPMVHTSNTFYINLIC
jgi:hypothetical protein